MKSIAVGLQAETLTPFAYHSLMIQGGTATLPELIGDRALAFGLAASLGLLAARVALPEKDYRRDMTAMPWRTSVLMTTEPRLLPPLIRRLNLDAEGGFPEKVHSASSRGNMKDFFLTQEVPPGVRFTGAIFGFDPFAETGQRELVLRIGLHRNGMVRLTPARDVSAVRLNSATAGQIFQRELPVERYLLHGLQLTPFMGMAEALQEVLAWK